MTNQHTPVEEGNRLIAEFDGWIRDDKVKDNPYWHPGRNITMYTCPDNFKYHSSWDWLMPVMEKIEGLRFEERAPWTSIKTFLTTKTWYECFIKINKKDGEKYLYEYEGEWHDKKIDAVYTAVIHFIQFYNTQTPQP